MRQNVKKHYRTSWQFPRLNQRLTIVEEYLLVKVSCGTFHRCWRNSHLSNASVLLTEWAQVNCFSVAVGVSSCWCCWPSVKMEPLITPSSSNHLFSESLQLQMLNDSATNSSVRSEIFNGSDHVTDHAIARVTFENLAFFLMCVIGIPGNLFVIVVYSWKMSTSTRVYLFALALADLEVCIIGVLLMTVKFTRIGKEIITFCVHTSLAFSTLLLAFVSLERLLAVRHPHSFSLSPRRAKWALVIIDLVAAVCAMVLTIARVKDYGLLIHVFSMSITMSGVVVMIGCYSLMAVTLLNNVRAAHRNVHVASMLPLPGTSGCIITLGITATPPNNATSHNIFPQSAVKSTTVKLAKTYKGVSVLFIITVVYIACWTPQWLSDLGFQVPKYVRRLYVLNAVINPFIYSAVSRMFRDDVRQFSRKMHSKLSRYCQWCYLCYFNNKYHSVSYL